jgi:hypothetical protein
MTRQEILESALSGKVNFEQYLSCSRIGCKKPELILTKKLGPFLKKLNTRAKRNKKGFAAMIVEWDKL